MNIPFDLLAQEVLRLPKQQRASLLDRVIASLDSDEARDAAWDRLAAQRDEQACEDPSLLVDGPAFLAELRAQLT
jgi:hypothetical protein